MNVQFALPAVALLLLGCSRMQTVARSPIDIGPAPAEVLFGEPVSARGPHRDLCFEFEHAGDSDLASTIRVTLVTTDGRKEPLTGELDRRGEALVALVGDVVAPSGERQEVTATEYRGVELSSERPMRLRGLRWASAE
jgi:hypothetical protein